MKVIVYENTAGFSSYCHKLCNALSKNIEDEIFYITSEENDYLKSIKENVRVMPILKGYDKSIKKGSFKWLYSRISVSIKNIIKRNRVVKQLRPDVVSLQDTMPVIDQFFIKKIKRYSKIIMTVHDVIPPNPSLNWSMNSLKKMYNFSDHLIVHTNTNKIELEKKFNITSNKISVIHHGTDIDYQPVDREIVRREFNLNNNKKTLLFFGSIRKQKGLDILLEALAGLDCQLIIAGSLAFGDTFEQYDDIIKKNRIECIELINYISEEQTNQLYQACDIVVLPYKYFHSMSGVFMQAVQYRKPVVVTDVSGFKEFNDCYKIGLVCEPNNVKSLKEAIIAMISDENKYTECVKNMYKAASENSWLQSSILHRELFLKMLC